MEERLDFDSLLDDILDNQDVKGIIAAKKTKEYLNEKLESVSYENSINKKKLISVIKQSIENLKLENGVFSTVHECVSFIKQAEKLNEVISIIKESKI